MKVDIYHEQQDSLLCGQHCLNNLLQAQIFTAIDLGEIANELDQKEFELYGGAVQNESANVDNSGNFSIQVLRCALQRFNNCDLEPWQLSKDGKDLDPLQEQGFVINRSEHWFTIRKIGTNWWDLNSTKEKPELISQFYLTAFLAQLRADGYSVFLVRGAKLAAYGEKPKFEKMIPQEGEGQWYSEESLLGRQGNVAATPTKVDPFAGKGNRLGDGTNTKASDFLLEEGDDEDTMLAKAISASLETSQSQACGNNSSSGGGGGDSKNNTPVKKMTPAEEMRAKRLAALEKRGL